MNRAVEQPPAPRRVLVACIGNPDRGDDGAGAAVAEKLNGRLPADLAVHARRGDILSLIEDWACVDALICVDAAAPVGVPGRIHRIDLAEDDLPRDLSLATSHAIGLAETIALARTLGRAPRQIIVYAIEGSAFDTGSAMSPEVAAVVGEVAEHIIAEANRLRQGAREIADDP